MYLETGEARGPASGHTEAGISLSLRRFVFERVSWFQAVDVCVVTASLRWNPHRVHSLPT